MLGEFPDAAEGRPEVGYGPVVRPKEQDALLPTFMVSSTILLQKALSPTSPDIRVHLGVHRARAVMASAVVVGSEGRVNESHHCLGTRALVIADVAAVV